jgi:hypothetical protein
MHSETAMRRQRTAAAQSKETTVKYFRTSKPV